MLGIFYIDTTTPSAPALPPYFNINFKLPKTDVKLGNYAIIARSDYQGTLGTAQKSIKVVLLGDLVKNGKIDMREIGALFTLYGSEEGAPDWNPEADLYKDGVINIHDVGRICNNFGETAIY